MKFRNCLLITLICLVTLLSICPGSYAAEDKPIEVTVAVCADFKPFEYIDDQGNIVGIDIEIMNEICNILNFKPTYINMNFDEMIPSVRSPLADFAISAITPAEHRKKVVDFTDNYIECKAYNPALDKYYEESYAIPVKFNDQYKERLNEAIALLKGNGKIDEIAQKYGLVKNSDGLYEFEMELKAQPKKDAYIVSEWAKSNVESAIAKHWTSPKDFQNNYTVNINREQFCELAYNMLRTVGDVGNVNLADTSFTDTKNPKVLYLAQEGIINGKGDGSYFAPADTLTRTEAAAILCRIARYSGISIPDYTGTPYEDDAEIPEWAKDMVYSVTSAKIMSGMGNGFSPMGFYTAEQAVATIERVYNSLK